MILNVIATVLVVFLAHDSFLYGQVCKKNREASLAAHVVLIMLIALAVWR